MGLGRCWEATVLSNAPLQGGFKRGLPEARTADNLPVDLLITVSFSVAVVLPVKKDNIFKIIFGFLLGDEIKIDHIVVTSME